jgi:hypothetical protein
VIGVVSASGEARAVREFFELFKTPWEFYVPHHQYDLLIVTSGSVPADCNTNLLAIYDSRHLEFDDRIGVSVQSKHSREWLDWEGVDFPIYGDVAVFRPAAKPFLRCRTDSGTVGIARPELAHRTVRIGYDLFKEIAFLLSKGQPPENAHLPTLEIHIALLRSVMSNAGLSFIEIPAAPAGYDFMACLTHDVDFTGIREHKFDHTMWGFIYRALAGSMVDALRGKLKWSQCLQNWKAVFSLPFVYLGLREDFWLEFDRYVEIEKGLGSTFFFLPFKNHPGRLSTGSAPKHRAAKYDVMAIEPELRKLMEHGCEVGVHGIDAWQSPQEGRTELRRIRDVTRRSEVGIRMHWLYFSEESPTALEAAGFSYDSTFGYNDAVGFRGGTAQAFCPTNAGTLLELPLSVQDTALFYPRRMNLSETEARESCQQVIEMTSFFGGALTINWHTRSLSPERLWGDFYAALLKQVQDKGAWFGTAEDIVTWFRMRRALRFEQVRNAEGGLYLKIKGSKPGNYPPFLIRVHHAQPGKPMSSMGPSAAIHSDVVWNGEFEQRIAT